MFAGGAGGVAVDGWVFREVARMCVRCGVFGVADGAEDGRGQRRRRLW